MVPYTRKGGRIQRSLGVARGLDCHTPWGGMGGSSGVWAGWCGSCYERNPVWKGVCGYVFALDSIIMGGDGIVGIALWV